MSEWILFRGYQDGEILNYETMFGDQIVHTIWSGYEDDSMLEDAGVPQQWREKFYLARQAGHWNEKPGDLEFPDLKDLQADGASLYAILVWDRVKFKEVFKTWVGVITDKRSEAHGDDSYYDYYPDLWHIADQIVAWSRDDVDYKEAVYLGKSEVYEAGLYTDEDVINHGFSVEGVAGIVQGANKL